MSNLDRRNVTHVNRSSHKFILRLQDGDLLRANRTVIATGIRGLRLRSGTLHRSPKEFVTHSSNMAQWIISPVARCSSSAAGRLPSILLGRCSSGGATLLVCRQPTSQVSPGASAAQLAFGDPLAQHPDRRWVETVVLFALTKHVPPSPTRDASVDCGDDSRPVPRLVHDGPCFWPGADPERTASHQDGSGRQSDQSDNESG